MDEEHDPPTLSNEDWSVQAGFMTRQVTSIVERLDLMEEKLGINITGVFASIKKVDERDFYICVNFDISSISGAALQENLEIVFAAYNQIGQVIGISTVSIFTYKFLGFDSLSTGFRVDQIPVKIRLFPKLR